MQQIRCLLMGILILAAACKKDHYYKDSGSHNPNFNGSTLDYLDSVPFYFDSVAAVVRLADMEEVFKSDTLTFFAPTDESILNLIKSLNFSLYIQGYDTVKTLADIPPTIWQKYLQIYMFHGSNELKDYPQIDYNLLSVYPGQGYLSWNGTAMNIGVVYNDDNGVKYVGYRQLSIAYIPDPARPMDNWNREMIASSNIITNNGVVHTLTTNHLTFGFDLNRFVSDMKALTGNGG